MTFRSIISHFQVRFLGLKLAARNILLDVFHILTPPDVAYEKYFSFMVVYIVYAHNTLTKNSNLKWSVIVSKFLVLSPCLFVFTRIECKMHKIAK